MFCMGASAACGAPPKSESPIPERPKKEVAPVSGGSAQRPETKTPATPPPLFALAEDDRGLFDNHRARLKREVRKRKYYFTMRAGKTVGIQFSQRKRLYDHNILLRALFAGRLVHRDHGNLQERFLGALFFDLGSGILYADGAPTVRDIHEDESVRRFLGALVASDINDPSSEKTRFVDIYRKTRNNLPFPVQEIPMAITRADQVDAMLRPYEPSHRGPLILRTVNTGIDYYYPEPQLRAHLQAVLEATGGRDVLYLFNKYVLFRAREADSFAILGELPDTVFMVERYGWRWRRINWSRRTVEQSFQPRARVIAVTAAPSAPARRPRK